MPWIEFWCCEHVQNVDEALQREEIVLVNAHVRLSSTGDTTQIDNVHRFRYDNVTHRQRYFWILDIDHICKWNPTKRVVWNLTSMANVCKLSTQCSSVAMEIFYRCMDKWCVHYRINANEKYVHNALHEMRRIRVLHTRYMCIWRQRNCRRLNWCYIVMPLSLA